MKLATFEIPAPCGPVRRIGAYVDDRLIDFVAAYAAHLSKTDAGCEEQKLSALIFAPDMVSFLELGTMGLDAARHAIGVAGRSDEAFGARTTYALSEVRLLSPVVRPRVMRDFLTFEGHMKQASRALGRGEDIPRPGMKSPPITRAIRTR